jgi:hypothetical protein
LAEDAGTLARMAEENIKEKPRFIAEPPSS